MLRIEAGLPLVDIELHNSRLAFTDHDRVTPKELGLLNQKGSRFTVYDIHGKPDASLTRTAQSALNRAQTAAEGTVFTRVAERLRGWVTLNKQVPSRAPEVRSHEHGVKLGRPRAQRPPGVLRASSIATAASIAFVLKDYIDAKKARFESGVAIFEDERGAYVVSDDPAPWLSRLSEAQQDLVSYSDAAHLYSKKYLSGERVQITGGEYSRIKKEVEANFGYVNWWGDFVPGRLQRELPVVNAPAPDPFTMVKQETLYR